jgi:predicted nucleic acid-binding protein
VKFWDSSAVIPLIVGEVAREALLELLEQDAGMIVWWGTPVECTSAIARRERDRALDPASAAHCIDRLDQLAVEWQEVLPSSPLRVTAQRLLRVHALRAADSLQLAAAIAAAELEPASLDFVSLDERLIDAAAREGFRITRV